MNKIIAVDVVYAPSLPVLLVNPNFNLNVLNPTFFPSICCSLTTRGKHVLCLFPHLFMKEGNLLVLFVYHVEIFHIIMLLVTLLVPSWFHNVLT